MTMPISV